MATVGSVTFAYRSDTTGAYYAPGGDIPSVYVQTANHLASGNGTVVAFATSGCIGGRALDLNAGNSVGSQYISWPGIGNSPRDWGTIDGITFAYRIYIPNGNTPTYNNALFQLGGFGSGLQAGFYVQHRQDSLIGLLARNEIGQAMVGVTVTPEFGFTNSSFFDMVAVLDATTGGKFEVFVNGNTFTSVNTSSRFNTSVLAKLEWPMENISFGRYNTSLLSEIYVNEAIIFGAKLSVASIASAFPGPSRTSFYDAGGLLPKVQPSSQSNAGVGNVSSGTNYIVNGNTFTGTLTSPVSTDPGVSNVLSGTGYTINDLSLTGTYNPPVSTDPGIANVLVGTGYTINNVSLTGDLVAGGTYTDPGTVNVANGVDYIFNDMTLTGTLSVPMSSTGPAGTVPLNALKENIRYILAVNNTTTGAPTLDLSSGLSRKVKTILKINPDRLGAPDDNAIPAVTVFTDSKDVEQITIAQTQLQGKRRAQVNLKVMGMVWEPHTTNLKTDPADEECEKLMENIERILRAYDTLGGNVHWHIPTSVTYHSFTNSEETHFRAGILDLQATIYY